MTVNKPKLVVILGPTAAGKTSLAIKLAKKFNGEIVSADSRQNYGEMNIGTDKPSKKEQNIVKHHLIDIRRPNQPITVSEYKKLAITAIKSIQQKNHLPFLVGGSGLYISAIVDNLDIPPVKPDKKYRAKIKSQIKRHELEIKNLYQDLLEKDPAAAEFVEPHNLRRIIRALEVIHQTGKKISSLRTKGQPFFEILQLGLKPTAARLEKSINKRVAKMFSRGLLQEVRRLQEKYPGHLAAFQSIGYREIIKYLAKEISLPETKSLIKLHTQQLAKRQLKWFRRDKNITWITNYSEAVTQIRKFTQ